MSVNGVKPRVFIGHGPTALSVVPAFEMTYTVSSGALNSTPTPTPTALFSPHRMHK